jgi:dihydroorotase
MKILIKQTQIVDPNSPFNGQKADILIDNGIIVKISNSINEDADKTIEQNGLHASPGWVDSFANFNDPGFEYKETLESGAAAAAAGGYTDVMIVPNTNPVVHNKAAVEYVFQRTQQLAVNIHPIGAVTKNNEGKELAEMYDMKNSGAIAFSDGLKAVQSGGLLIKALQYIKAFNGVIIQLPDDNSINAQGLINEGLVSTQLGLPGRPAIAEEIMVARDIALTEYANSKLHFASVSTGESIEKIIKAKQNGISVTSAVCPYHLYFSDEDLTHYDTNLKVNPPIRTKEDKAQLINAVLNGNIDCVASHHLPHEKDSKVIEFENAQFGMIGLETAYAVLNTAVSKLTPLKSVELLAVNPRNIFNLPNAAIKEGNNACITLFNPNEEWVVSKSDIKSMSCNTPFIGKKLKGKVVGIINKKQLSIN